MALSDQNVFVGISLSNKHLTIEQVTRIRHVAYSHFSARNLAFLLTDEIERLNEIVFEHHSFQQQSNSIEQRCEAIESVIRKGIPDNEFVSGRVTICRWKDILNPSFYDTLIELNSLFIEDMKFQNDVFEIAKAYAWRRRTGSSKSEIFYICHYVLAELPTFIHGVVINDRVYPNLIYPALADGAIDGVVRRLFNGTYSTKMSPSKPCRIVKM